MQIIKGDIIRTLRDNIAYIGHFHTAGNPGRNELDENQELYYPAICRAIAAAICRAIAAAICRAIAATGYDGYVGQEFTPKSDAVAALEQAYKACDV